MSDEKPAQQPNPASSEPVAPAAAPTPPPTATAAPGAEPPRTRFRDRVVSARAAVGVGAAGLVLGGLGGAALGATTTYLVVHDHGRGDGEWVGPGFGREWDGRGQFPGPPEAPQLPDSSESTDPSAAWGS